MELNIYPNPANDFIYVNLKTSNLVNSTLEIKDLMGKSILEKEITKSNQRIYTSKLAPGIYMVTLSNRFQLSKTKLIIR